MNENQKTILNVLAEHYKEYETVSSLNHSSPYESLVATMLAAQCTDARVNIVTAELFKNYNTPEKMVRLNEEELKTFIKSCGLSNTKAKNILAASRILIEQFNSEVPRTKKEIMTLPGVGSKTANVVLANAYGVPGLAVDTHVGRVATRLGLTSEKTPAKIEKALCLLIPEKDWLKAHRWLLWHGRLICRSRNPDCQNCPVGKLCPSFSINKKES